MIRKTLLIAGIMVAGMYAYGQTATPTPTQEPTATPTPEAAYETSFEQTFDGATFPPCESQTCWAKDGSATTTTAMALSAPYSVLLDKAGAAMITPPMSTSGKVFTCRYLNLAVGDMLRTEYSTDGGTTWNFYRKHTATPNFWAEIEYDLSVFNAVSVQFRISWEDYNDETAVVYLDNAKLADKARGAASALVDFDGDKKSDLVAYYPGTGTWNIKKSSDGSKINRNWGWTAAAPAVADYDGDGITDIAVFADGWWFIDGSTSGFLKFNYGFQGCIPVPVDFNGDGVAEPTLYYPPTGTWFIKFLSTSMDSETDTKPAHETVQLNWGYSDAYPVPADYDGDGMADICVYSPEFATWYLLTSKSHYTQSEIINWGWMEMLPVPVDFNGNQHFSFGGYYSEKGTWYEYPDQVLNNWGFSEAVPLVGDYDGDGKTDQAVAADVNSGLFFYINASSQGPQEAQMIASDESIAISASSLYNYLLYLMWVYIQP